MKLPLALLPRPGTLSCLPGGNEPAPTKYGRPASDLFGTSYQRHPGQSDPSSVCFPVFSRFPLSSPSLALTVGHYLAGRFSRIQGDGGGDFALQFSLTFCALFPVLKQRVELLKVLKRKKDHTGGGGPELLAKMLKEHCR